VPLNAGLLTPPQDRHAGQFGAVIRDALDRGKRHSDDQIAAGGNRINVKGCAAPDPAQAQHVPRRRLVLFCTRLARCTKFLH